MSADRLHSRDRVPTAPTIPLPLAEGEAVFFYGTLMDRQVLRAVLGRTVLRQELVPATLVGFRREAALDLPYPLLVADENATVNGRMFLSSASRDIARINHFEHGEYWAARHSVLDRGGKWHQAWLYVALDCVLRPSGRPWELRSWARGGRATLLEACPQWMKDCPELG